MSESLVLTVIGPDRPGLVESISSAITRHEGNWLESRMSRLGGQFAGILHVSVPESRVDALTGALRDLDSDILRVLVERGATDAVAPTASTLQLELTGTDSPGIIRDISRALAELRVNVEELTTERVSAPMSGEWIFKASARLGLPPGVAADQVHALLETVANDLVVDIRLDDGASV